MLKQDLENQLNSLRLKWKGKVPKNNMDSDWWKFICDRSKANLIKKEIKKIDGEHLL